MAKSYVVNLTEDERATLEHLVKGERVSGLKRQRASILLKSDDGLTDEDIADELEVGVATVERVRRRCIERGVEACLERKPQANPSRPRKFDGRTEATLVQLACSEPPAGRTRWTLDLLGDRLVELKVFEQVSRSSVHRTLKKNEIKPWRVERFCIPPEQNAAFVAAMEDVLEVYHRPYDPERPQVCLDETSKQLLEHTRTPIPATATTPARTDDEYKRCGTASIFAAVEPLTGNCVVEARAQRTAVDMAHFLRRLSDEEYPTAKCIVLVMDNLNTHGPHCLYEAFEPAEARRLVERFEIHHTPKHGSWLDIAEIFLSVISKQSLDQRIGSLAQLQTILAEWRAKHKGTKVHWRFTTVDARIKLRRLYPSLS